jgi:hypothetical protein
MLMEAARGVESNGDAHIPNRAVVLDVLVAMRYSQV